MNKRFDGTLLIYRMTACFESISFVHAIILLYGPLQSTILRLVTRKTARSSFVWPGETNILYIQLSGVLSVRI